MCFDALVKGLLADGLVVALAQKWTTLAQTKTESTQGGHVTPRNVLLCPAVADIGMIISTRKYVRTRRA